MTKISIHCILTPDKGIRKKGESSTMSGKEKGDFVFEITEHIGVIKSYNNGWTKEINMVAWNDTKPKYDIRDWNPDHQQMARGITLHVPEMRTVLELLKDRPDLVSASAAEAVVSAPAAAPAENAAGPAENATASAAEVIPGDGMTASCGIAPAAATVPF